MKIKPLLCAAIMAVSCVILPSTAQAETTYASPSELITDAVEVALSGVESSTYDIAIANMQSLITVSGNDVSYDGAVIGYWDSTVSDVLYKDSSMTEKVLYADGENIWRFEPTLLAEILEDVNNDLIETIVPTTADWNKIIGKYDVTLGGLTIPASDWHPLEVADSTNEGFTNKQFLDLYSLYGEYITSYKYDKRHRGYFVYMITDTGELYIQNQISEIHKDFNDPQIKGSLAHMDGTCSFFWSVSAENSGKNYLAYGNYYYPKILLGFNDNHKIYSVPLVSDAAATDYIYGFIRTADDWTTKYDFYKVGDLNSPYTGDFSNTTVGVAMFNEVDYEATASHMVKMISNQPQSSKQQIGNTTLKRRLSKFSSLVEGDTIEVTPTAWTIYGLGGEESDFDTFLADQNMINPGDTADISAVADVESLGFSVILPTTLPIYVDKLNQVSVATNATVENKSGAAVELQTIDIQAKPNTGWTLITNGEPSKKRDAQEFTFTTSLTDGTILDTGEIKPFSYNAKLSPLTEGVESLDLASVLVTVDWAPEE